MKTECNDLDEKAAVRKFHFLVLCFEVESCLCHILITSFVWARTKGIEYCC